MTMTRTEIARRLHDLVDAWLENPLGTEMWPAHMLWRITLAKADDSEAIVLVVGTEPQSEDDRGGWHDAEDDA